jgi:hypothetical protein
VLSHLRTTHYEFQNYFSGQETHITLEIARNCPKILIRAFFYARLDPPTEMKTEVPASWTAYVGQFCNVFKLGTTEGKEELKRYLLSTFGMKYESREEIEGLLATDAAKKEVSKIAEYLKPQKSAPALAQNDALMVLAVYGRRAKTGESNKPTVFGYHTWWLTGETKILQHTRDLVSKYGARYMMRPEFLLNFIAMSPKLAQVRAAYKNTFPSLLGVRLANRVKDDVYQDMMAKVKDAACLEPGRVEAMVSGLSDKLKSDFKKIYPTRATSLNHPSRT